MQDTSLTLRRTALSRSFAKELSTTRLTYEPGNESAPTWSPDDKRIYYLGDSAGHDDLCQISSGGTGGGERLFIDTYAKRPTDLSADGRWLIFNSGPNRLSALTDI